METEEDRTTSSDIEDKNNLPKSTLSERRDYFINKLGFSEKKIANIEKKRTSLYSIKRIDKTIEILYYQSLHKTFPRNIQ